MSAPVRAWRWTKRHPGPASVLLTLVVATVLVWTLSLVHSNRIRTANAHLQSANQRYKKSQMRAERNAQQATQNARRAERSARRAEQSAQRARNFLYATDMSLADRACQRGDVSQMLSLLNRHRPVPGEPDSRGFEWNFLYRSVQMKQRTLLRFQGDVYQVRFSADGRLLASGGDDRLVRLWSLDRETPPKVLAGHRGRLISMTFSPDGRSLLTIGKNSTLSNRGRTFKVWNVTTRQEILSRPDGAYERAALSPDGRSLVIEETHRRIRVVDVSPPVSCQHENRGFALSVGTPGAGCRVTKPPIWFRNKAFGR